MYKYKVFTYYENLIDFMNTAGLMKEDIVQIIRQESTGTIILIYIEDEE